MKILFLSPSFSEIILVAFLVLLLFGSKKLPDLARGLGKGIREFKDATGQIQNEIRSGMNEVERPMRELGRTEDKKEAPMRTVEQPANSNPRNNA